MKYLLLIFPLLISCDRFDNRLTIINNTTDTVYFDISKNGRFANNPLVLDSDRIDTLWDYMRFIYPKDSIQIPLMGRNEWENHINKYYKDSTLTLFLFDKRLINITATDNLISKQIHTKKFAFKAKDLEKLNWRIVYK